VKFNTNFSNVHKCLYIFRVYDTIASVDHFTMSSKKTSAVISFVYIDKNNKYAFIIYAKY